jgi:hypothetical protein
MQNTGFVFILHMPFKTALTAGWAMREAAASLGFESHLVTKAWGPSFSMANPGVDFLFGTPET